MCRQPRANGCGTHAESDKPLLARIGFHIRDRDRVRIVKHRKRFGHTDAVLAKVDPSLALFVPLETHNLSVRTLCAYFKGRSRVARSLTAPLRRLRANPVDSQTRSIPGACGGL